MGQSGRKGRGRMLRNISKCLVFTIISMVTLSNCQQQGPIPGLAGEDYPNFSFPPETSFQCAGLVGGYYADQEADCQSYHICGEGGSLLTTRLCPLGTLYNQQYFICDWWFNVDCSVADQFYSLNDEVRAAGESANSRRGGNSGRGGNSRRGGKPGRGGKTGRGWSGYGYGLNAGHCFFCFFQMLTHQWNRF